MASHIMGSRPNINKLSFENYSIEKVILDILDHYEKDFEKKTIVYEVNQYLRDFWDLGTVNSISLSEQGIKAKDNNSEVDLKDRGMGFQAFIYIFIRMVISAKLLYERNGLILVEEPEKMLHPQAQRDFIKAVEAIANDYENCKFIITTHSPIIINHSNEGNILLLQKDKNTGVTNIQNKAYEHNWRDLRTNLGVLPSDSLIFGKTNLIVEGASEFLFIKKLLRLTKIELDLDNISVINAGGADNIEKLVKVTKGEEAILNKVVVLVDNDSKGNSAIKALKKEPLLLDEKYIVKLETVNNQGREITFEDMFPRELRVEAINKIYNTNITIEEITNHRNSLKDNLSWISIVEDYLKEKKIINKESSMDKIEICNYMVENINGEQIHSTIIKLAKLLKELQIAE